MYDDHDCLLTSSSRVNVVLADIEKNFFAPRILGSSSNVRTLRGQRVRKGSSEKPNEQHSGSRTHDRINCTWVAINIDSNSQSKIDQPFTSCRCTCQMSPSSLQTGQKASKLEHVCEGPVGFEAQRLPIAVGARFHCDFHPFMFSRDWLSTASSWRSWCRGHCD